MAKAPITKRTVDAAKPAEVEYVVWDDGGKETVKGFGLKVTPAGAKVYIYRYRISRPGAADQTPPRKYTIGKHGNLTPDQARTRAKALAAMVEQGIDPRQTELDAMRAKDEAKRQAEVKAKLEGELVFEKVAERWLEEYELNHRPASVGQAKVSINKYLLPKLSGKAMPHIGKADLQAAIDAIPASRKASRQQVFAYASILFRWAMERGEIADNPVTNMAKPKGPKARDRVLADDELALIWKATDKLRAPLGAFYRVLMLTGQRREEVAGMAWSELNRTTAVWIIPANRAKNGVAQIVPLAPAVIHELDQLALATQVRARAEELNGKRWPKVGPVMSFTGKVSLSSFSQAKAQLDAEITKVCKASGTVEPWRVHDLRRTMATGFQRLGIRFEVTEATLNHVSGAKGGVAGIYQRHDWREEKQAALHAWARHLAAIVAPAEGTNVVSFVAGKQSA